MSGSEVILGIDLGTTYSTAAAVVGGKVHFAVDGRGENCIPSVVHFPKSGAPLVGFEADKLRVTDPHNTVFGVKRILGRRADSPAARLLDAVAAFRILKPTNAEAMIRVRTGDFSATEIASHILRYLRERAEFKFGRRIHKAVLTVPVSADATVRQAMVRCGKAAGLEVLRTIDEPIAGAVARGFTGTSWGHGPVLVYDFGGGTLDTTVVELVGQAIKVLAVGGDDCLGGDDFDVAFARYVANGIYRVHAVDITKDAVLWERVQRQCELAKRALSARPEVRYQLREAFTAAGKEQHLDYTFRRDHLAPEWEELVTRSIVSTRRTLQDAGVGVSQLGAALLIGGTTWIPQVRAAMGDAVPRPLAIEADPQTAVARGAAMIAADPRLLAE